LSSVERIARDDRLQQLAVALIRTCTGKAPLSVAVTVIANRPRSRKHDDRRHTDRGRTRSDRMRAW
jgi:hypothetical protein